MPQVKSLLATERIESKIILIRGHKVMVDAELAKLYAVSTSRLNEQVKRNIKRFPPDFMFQLTKKEYENLISQSATSSWGGLRKRPFVFTEHGAVMATSVLNSKIAVQASIHVVRAFVKHREILSFHKDLALKFELLERKLEKHDEDIQTYSMESVS